MNALDKLMINIPTSQVTSEEKTYIRKDKEYFAVTPIEFLIYSKSKKCWYCLRTKIVISGNISDIIDKNGDMNLFVKGKVITSGKWGFADSMSDILDFYNSGKYLDWLASFS